MQRRAGPSSIGVTCQEGRGWRKHAGAHHMMPQTLQLCYFNEFRALQC